MVMGMFETIERQRITEDGKALVRKAAEIADMADATESSTAKCEFLGESRQWLKLALEHDKATDSKLLRELSERLSKKERRREKLRQLREETLARDVGAQPKGKKTSKASGTP